MSHGLAVGIAIWIASVIIGGAVGRRKGRQGTAELLTIFLGVVGLVIVLCLSESREAQVQEAQRQFEVQAEAARRAGYPYPPYPSQPPSGPPAWPQAPRISRQGTLAGQTRDSGGSYPAGRRAAYAVSGSWSPSIRGGGARWFQI